MVLVYVLNVLIPSLNATEDRQHWVSYPCGYRLYSVVQILTFICKAFLENSQVSDGLSDEMTLKTACKLEGLIDF